MIIEMVISILLACLSTNCIQHVLWATGVSVPDTPWVTSRPRESALSFSPAELSLLSTHSPANFTCERFTLRSFLIILSCTLLPSPPSPPPHTHSDFPVQYEGPHVISKEQMWVGVVSRGCDGVSLNSSYENRYPYHLWLPHATCLNDIWKAPNLPGSVLIGFETSEFCCGLYLCGLFMWALCYHFRSTASYQSSLGNTIGQLNITCHTMVLMILFVCLLTGYIVNFARIVPQGLLVFFPSYPVMHSCINHWRVRHTTARVHCTYY